MAFLECLQRQRICLVGGVSLGIFLVALFYIKRKPKQNLTEQISNDNSDYIESTQEEDEIEDEFDFCDVNHMDSQ